MNMDLKTFKAKYRWHVTALGILFLLLTLLYVQDEVKKPQIYCFEVCTDRTMVGCGNGSGKICDTIENITRKYPWVNIER